MIANHYGYGLRNDEKPFAHKIPTGGNWKSLPREDQVAFMKGSIDSDGGKTTYLRRLTWDEPALTILASPMAKASCQLHPGDKYWEVDSLIQNHQLKLLTQSALGHGDKHKAKGNGFGCVFMDWNKPCLTLDSHTGGGNTANVYPIDQIERSDLMSYNVTPQLNSNGFTLVELFCGGGIGGVGMKSAGYNVLAAYDFDKSAVKAYRYNLGNHAHQADITQLPIEDIPDADVIFGGPPCQDFSVAGKGLGEEGERGKLVWRYLEIIEKKKPKAFIFENVKGLIGKRHRQTFNALIEEFERIGYTVSWQIIMAWDYGVAQKRERVFIVGVRQDIGITYEFPQPNEKDYRTQVLRDVIGDLPEPIDTCGKNVKQAEHKADLNEPSPAITTQYRCQTIEITNHNPESKLPKYVQNILDGKSKTNFGQMPINDGEKPAYTVMASYATKKPNEITSINGNPRRFTVRECLRIQSVPDWYVFTDDISLSAQYRIVGNGVASRVAYLLGIALAEQLNASERIGNGQNVEESGE